MKIKSLILLIALTLSPPSFAALYVVELKRTGSMRGGIFIPVNDDKPKIPNSILVRTGRDSERDSNDPFLVHSVEEYLGLVEVDDVRRMRWPSSVKLLSEPQLVQKIKYDLFHPAEGNHFHHGDPSPLYPAEEWAAEVSRKISSKKLGALHLTIMVRTPARVRHLEFRGPEALAAIGMDCEGLLR